MPLEGHVERPPRTLAFAHARRAAAAQPDQGAGPDVVLRHDEAVDQTRGRLSHSVLPLYARLKEDISVAIARGELAPGDQLPPQRTLCDRYGMSHMTVRRAINELVNEGVIYGVPGKGLFVAEQKQEAEAGPLIGFTEDMAARGMTASSQVLTAELVGASTMLARALAVSLGSQLVRLRRLRLADGEPMALQTAYLPHALCPGLLDHDLEAGSLYELLRTEYGYRLADATAVAEAALAEPEEAALLKLALPAALFVTEQLTFLEGGQPIEFVRSAYRGDRYRLRVR